MTNIHPSLKPLKLLLVPAATIFLLPLTSCTSTELVSANSRPAIQASEPVPQEQLLDIGIQPLDPGLPKNPEDLEEELTVADVRRAESNLIAYHLKDTLELTGNWGAVRLTPSPSNAVDIEVTGAILVSNGEELKVQIHAKDATGRTWLKQTYSDSASKFNYDTPSEDPFQDLYNDIANDLLMARRKLAGTDLANIKQVARLKFAKDLAPDAFANYLEEGRGGKASIVQLPAENDSMMTRVARIKEQEYLFVDTLDDFYNRFYREVRPSYDEWRKATYDEAIRLQEVKKQSRNRLIGGALLVAGGIAAGTESTSSAMSTAAVGTVVGGVGLIRSGLERRKEAEIHAATLKELSQSLGAEIAPNVLTIEGHTIELTGSANQQYAQWRQTLREIYAEETGLPATE
ncbi:MAG: hypothetical protein ACR2PJ_01390 [Pseudomonadales bacterium]